MTQTSQPIAPKDATPASDDEIRIARLAAEHYGRPASDVPALIAFERYRAEQAKILGMHGLSGSIPAFIAGFNIGLSPQAAAEPVAVTTQIQIDSLERNATCLMWSPTSAPENAVVSLYVGAPPAQALVQQWQPIETAPKDELILLAGAKRAAMVVGMNHSRDGWVIDAGSEWATMYTPTHWMPLPAAPDAAPVQPVQQEADAQFTTEQKAAAFDEWIEKTSWVQEKINTFPVKSLGKHRADVMRDEIEYLRAKDKP